MGEQNIHLIVGATLPPLPQGMVGYILIKREDKLYEEYR